MTTPSIDTPPNRCRLILMMQGAQLMALSAEDFQEVVQAGDMACIIFSPGVGHQALSEDVFQSQITPLVEITQKTGIAAIVAEHSRIAGRVGADGLQLGQDPQQIEEAIEKYTPKMMVGAANVKTRHNALVLGEMQPDYVMFGKAGGDSHPQANPKNLELGEWWSQIVEIPCVVLGGNDVSSVVSVAKTGADFVALSDAVFTPSEANKAGNNAVELVKQANQLLDEHAPQFEIE